MPAILPGPSGGRGSSSAATANGTDRDLVIRSFDRLDRGQTYSLAVNHNRDPALQIPRMDRPHCIRCQAKLSGHSSYRCASQACPTASSKRLLKGALQLGQSNRTIGNAGQSCAPFSALLPPRSRFPSKTALRNRFDGRSRCKTKESMERTPAIRRIQACRKLGYRRFPPCLQKTVRGASEECEKGHASRALSRAVTVLSQEWQSGTSPRSPHRSAQIDGARGRVRPTIPHDCA